MSSGSKAKPTLAGTNIRVRKRAANQAAKYEPTAFRTALIQQLEAVAEHNKDDAGDFDGFAKKLDELGNSLDFRKYEQELFQLLVVGRLVNPGGTTLNDGSPPCPFSLLTSATKEPADLHQVKAVVDVFNKLLRRFKYLQKDFEETSLPFLLQHVNKFDGPAAAAAAGGGSGPAVPSGASTPVQAPVPIKPAASLPVPGAGEGRDSQPPSRTGTPVPGGAALAPAVPRPNQDKLAMATALFVTQGLVTPAILTSIRKDHLVKDGSALAFLTVYLKAFLAVEALDVLTASLRKGGVSDLLDFFPAARRTFPELAAHFKASKLEPVTELYQKQKGGELARETLAHLREMVAGTESNEEIVAYLKQQEKSKSIAEADFIALIWTGIVSGVDLKEGDAPAITANLLKEVKELGPVLEAFCQSARTEVALVNTVQVWCYDNSVVQGAFTKILMTLFNVDVLSSQAIIYWHGKGSKPQGRQTFLKAAQPLVAKLQEQEDESDDE